MVSYQAAMLKQHDPIGSRATLMPYRYSLFRTVAWTFCSLSYCHHSFA